MFRKSLRSLSVAGLLLGVVLLAIVTLPSVTRPASGAAGGMSPTVHHTVLPVSCVSTPVFTSAYTKIADFGEFTVINGQSTVEATFYGRVSADTLTGTSGAAFELRIDDAAAPIGRARATVRDSELSYGVQVSMSGVFPELSPGVHAVSVWVKAGGSGTGTGGRVDPGCWSTDHIVVREFAPFGTTFLPYQSND
jgi:hypothetical protein